MNQNSNRWPQDRLDELERLARIPGLSCSARQLGTTASAIVGKLNRMGLNKSVPERAARSGARGKQAGAKASVKQQRRASARSEDAVATNGMRRAIRRAAPAPAPVTSFVATAKTLEPFVARSGGKAAVPCGLMDLKSDSCRWPFGDPREKDFHFCGGKAIEGGPYCGIHAEHAWARR